MVPPKKKLKRDHKAESATIIGKVTTAKKDIKDKNASIISAALSIGDLSSLSVEDVRDLVTKAGIVFDNGNTFKPELLALWCLFKLKLLKRGDTANEELICKIVNWIGLANNKLVSALRKKDLDAKGGKWAYIEALIRDSIESGEFVQANPEDAVNHGNKDVAEDEEGLVNKSTYTVKQNSEERQNRGLPPPRAKADQVERLDKKASHGEEDDTDWNLRTVAQLKEALKNRGTAVTSKKADLVDRLKPTATENAKELGDDPVDSSTHTVAQLKDQLERRGLASTDSKADLIKRLTGANKELNKDKSVALPGKDGAVYAPDQKIDPAVVNLLLSTIYGEFHRSQSLRLLPGYASENIGATTVSVKALINQIPAFTTSEELAAALALPRTSAEEFLSWVCAKFGANLTVAQGAMKISGMPSSVAQFVISKPMPELQVAFAKARAKAANGKQSMVVFHGTPSYNIHSILQTGFRPSCDGLVYTAEEPAVSYGYAAKGGYNSSPWWKNDPYKNFGGLFGCEIVYKHMKYPGIHTISNPREIIARYLFMLPPGDLGFHDGVGRKHAPPARAAVENTLLRNFAKI